MEATKPVLITLTAPSAAGKSYLFNYIRDVAKLPCLISTTTREKRANEVEGQDYYFISEEESIRLEKEDLLAELAIYKGVRYGVTKEEFHKKLSQGMAFLICEPGGIDHYVKPAKDVGAIHYKTFVHVDPQLRIQRFKERALMDLALAAGKGDFVKTFDTYFKRFEAMLTEEMTWGNMHQWDRILFGDKHPQENLDVILADVKKIQDQAAEVKSWYDQKALDHNQNQWTRFATER